MERSRDGQFGAGWPAVTAPRGVACPAATAAARAVASDKDQAGSVVSIGTSNSPDRIAARLASIAGTAPAGTKPDT